jgi:hypothetical protein
MMTDARYPIGSYVEQPFSAALLQERLLDIRFLPNLLESALLNLDAVQQDQSIREGAWTIKQIAHHLADSHLNAYIRFKLALTEENPIIKPYDQDTWAALPDSLNMPSNYSCTLLHALHHRWHYLMSVLNENDWSKTYYHPEYQKTCTLWYLLGLYAWHGKHHVAQIDALRKSKGWG